MGMIGTLIWYTTINQVFFFYNHNAMSMAMLVCFQAFGTSLTNVVEPYLYKQKQDFGKTLMMPIYVQLFALLCIVVINKIDRMSTIKRNNLRYIRLVTHKLKSDKNTSFR
jgi:hypothetical protein